MASKKEALIKILSNLHGKRLEEVADHILALFHAPERWKPEDHHEVYRVSACGDIRTFPFLRGEDHSERLWAFGNCFQTKEDAAHARDALRQFLMTFHTKHE